MCAIRHTPSIRTPRLRLRPVTTHDASAIAAYAADFDVSKMTTRIPHPFGLADAESFIAGVGSGTAPDEAAFAICSRDKEGELLGVLGFHRSHVLGLSEMGYWLGKPHWGQGFATEAVGGALQWARDGWGKRVLAGSHFADNPASGAVLVKAGFLYTGDVIRTHSAARRSEVSMRGMVWLA